MAPYKLAELQRLRRPETRVKLLFFVNSRLLLPKKSSQLEMYVILSTFSIKCTLEKCDLMCVFSLDLYCLYLVALHVFITVRCYRRNGTKKRGNMNCVRFRSTCLNN